MASVPQSGIYVIRGPGGCLYIGSAVDVKKRWTFHRSLLRRGIHHATHLQHAYNRYGPDAFGFAIVEIVTDLDDLIPAEQRWLDRIFASHPRQQVYNVCRYAENRRGHKPSAETLALLSKIRKGAKKSDHMRQALSKARKGMRFEPSHCDNNAMAKSGGKVYTLIAPDGTEYPNVVNLSAFAREHGLTKSGFSNMAAGLSKQHRGWTLRLQSERGTQNRD